MKTCKWLITCLGILFCSVHSLAIGATAGLNVVRVNRPQINPIVLDSTITEVKLRNEIGIGQEEDYVSDLGGYWSYSTLNYYRFTDKGTYGGRINYANRYANGGEQYQLEAYPKFTDNLYATLTVALSNTSQRVFPHYQYVVEPYYAFKNGFVVSLGQRYARTFDVNIYTYTGSVGHEVGNYFIWVRPYHYTPKSTNYVEVGVRRTFEDENKYLSLTIGGGRTPDIGDLPPLNQIITLSAKALNLSGQLPLSKAIFLRGNVGYIKQDYQTGNERNIKQGSIGLIWRF